jgi:hypothetical protein
MKAVKVEKTEKIDGKHSKSSKKVNEQMENE